MRVNGKQDIVGLLQGYSYKESIIPVIEREISLTKTYNAEMLICYFGYQQIIKSSGGFNLIASVEYIER